MKGVRESKGIYIHSVGTFKTNAMLLLHFLCLRTGLYKATVHKHMQIFISPKQKSYLTCVKEGRKMLAALLLC